LRDSYEVAKEISNRSIIGMHRGGLGSMYDIYLPFSDLVGDKISQSGWGGWIGHG
jgi:hypothetical protein